MLKYLLFLLALPVFAQTNAQTVYVTNTPSGACSARTNLRLLTPTGALYTCQSGTWGAIGGGGGGACSSLGGDVTGTCAANTIKTNVALAGSPTTTTQASGDSATKIATTAYVSNALASINPAVSVEAATTGVLSNTPTYNNGTAGVGATLTAGSAGVLTVDGYSPAINEPILVKNQASALQNGVYTLTTVGTGGVAYVLTRRTDYNAPSNINYTGTIPVINGSTLANTGWNLDTQITAVGTSSMTYTQAAAGNSGGPPGGNVKATGNLTTGNVITGAGGKTIQDSGIAFSTITRTVASGAKALATGAISSAACTSAQTDTATGTLTTDAIIVSFNADPTAVTGYVPLTTGMLTIIPYPTSNTVNFKVCNNTASSITPGAITLNWRVVR